MSNIDPRVEFEEVVKKYKPEVVGTKFFDYNEKLGQYSNLTTELLWKGWSYKTQYDLESNT